MMDGPAGGGPASSGSSPSGSGGTQARATGTHGTGGNSGPKANAHIAVHSENAPGPVLSSFSQICAALQADKQINLLYDIEHYVRPANIDYGVFTYTPTDGIPKDFQLRLKNWLEKKTGVEWKIDKGHSTRESLAERQMREHRERVAEVSKDPLVADALAHLPGAKIIRIEKLDQDENGKVVRIDFSRKKDFSQIDED
jgi:DNA polymerase-3 subunit gamma/tau